MLSRSWRFIIPFIVIASCGETPEVNVAKVNPVLSKEEAGKPVTGDWLVYHEGSDPEQLNPLTSSDTVSSDITGYIFEALLTRDPRTLEIKP